MPRGVKLGGLPAVATCLRNNYVVGDILVSDTWSSPKKIEKIRERDVIVNKERVKSFPPDVRRVS
jgi:hypothetical protein